MTFESNVISTILYLGSYICTYSKPYIYWKHNCPKKFGNLMKGIDIDFDINL